MVAAAELMKNDARTKPSGDKLTVALNDPPHSLSPALQDEFDRAFPDVIHVESTFGIRRAGRFFVRTEIAAQVNCGRPVQIHADASRPIFPRR